MSEKYLDIASGSGGCFLEDTKVLTPNGLVDIVSIKAGDEVIAFDDKGTLHVSKVISTNTHENKDVYRYNFWGGAYLDATPNHWVLNADNSFIEIGKVDESVALVNASGFLSPIISKKYLGTFKVYNLIVDTYHTYIANGIRVHNGGGGKSGSSHVPSEAPDTLKSKTYAKVIDLLCEGEIEGLVEGARSIYFDGTPLMNSDGTYNYEGVEWDTREGTNDQTPIEGFDEIEAESTVNVKISKSNPHVVSIADPTVDKVRLALSIPSLFQQESDGDLVGSSISYQVLMQKNGTAGSGASAYVSSIADGAIGYIPITNGGSGYATAGTTLTISGAGTGATATPVVSNGCIKTVTVNSVGSNYINLKAYVSGDGTGAEIELIIDDYWSTGEYWERVYELDSIRVVNTGSGYTKASIIFSADIKDDIIGTLVLPTATANISNGVITGINITSEGQNYTTSTSVTAVGSGSGATFGTVTLYNGNIKTITVSNGGTGYDSPSVYVVDRAGIGTGFIGSVVTNTATGAVTAVNVIKGGFGYTTDNAIVTIANGGYYPVTVTYAASNLSFINNFILNNLTFNKEYTFTGDATKGIVALINPYVFISPFTNLVYTYYSKDSYGAYVKIEYADLNDPSKTYSTLAVGNLNFTDNSLSKYFALEEVYKAYNDIKSINPSITLTYDEYIMNRLNDLSPFADQRIKDQVLAIAKSVKYIIPVPYFTYDKNLTTSKNYTVRAVVQPYNVTTYSTTNTVGLFEVEALVSSDLVTITGKTTSKYTINHTITLPRTSESDQFDIKVVRLTDDSTLSSLQNDLYWESYATIVSNKLNYPNSALFAIKIDSENFSSIPTRGYHAKLLKIKIPDNYDPITGLYNRRTTDGGTTTNLLTYSEEFDNAAWVSSNTNVIANATVAPDGTMSADKLVETATTAAHYINNISNYSVSNNTVNISASVYLKAAERTRAILALVYATNVGCSINIDLTNGTTSTIYNANFTNSNVIVTALSNGWYRVNIYGRYTPTGPYTANLRIYTATSSTQNFYSPGASFAGTLNSGIYVWGAQLEVGTIATDYIKTGAVPASISRPVGSLAYDSITGLPVEQLWTGNFYTAWSNNPAWCFYDLVTNSRYGLGEYVLPEYVDEYTLYTIGKYCDELVPDGYGGVERRFTLNTYIQTRQEAVKLLQDMASAFRGMLYWSTGMITAVQDAAGDTPVYQFNNSNVINGEFNYAGASRKVIHNAVMVTWNDPQLRYRQRIEYVEDREAIDKYGYNQADIVAFGCTSRGQAHRAGKALLYTEKVENNLVSFKAALDAVYIRPGLLIKIQDDTRSGTLANGNIIGGRILSVNGAVIELDRPLTMDGTSGYTIRFNTINTNPDSNIGFTDILRSAEYDLISYNDSRTTVTATASISDANIGPGTVYTIVTPVASEEIYRVLAIKEGDEAGTYEISAMLHNPSKYDYIENDLQLETYNYSTLTQTPYPVTFTPPVTVEGVITSAPLMDNIYISGGVIDTYLNISFNASLYAAKYDIYLKKDSDDYVLIAKDLNRTSYTHYGVKDGSLYRVKIIAKNFTGLQSSPAYYPSLTSAAYTVLGKTRPPSDVTNFNINITDAGFIEGTWDNVPDLDLNTYEIKVGDSGSEWENASPLKIVKATSFTTEATLVGDKKYFIKALDTSGIYSTNATTDTLTINAPAKPTVTGTAAGTSIRLSWNDCKTTFPIKYYYIYVNTTTSAVATVGSAISYDLPISWASSANIYVKAEDIAGNMGLISNSFGSSLTGPTISNVSSSVINADYILSVTASAGSLPISTYLVKFDAQTWPQAASYASSSITIPITWLGNKYVEIKAVDILGVESSAYVVGNLTVSAPATPSISTQFSNTDNSIKLTWQDCKTTLPIDFYQVFEDAATTISLGKSYTLSAIYPVNWETESNYYYVRATDINGVTSGLGTAVATPTTWGAVGSPSYTIVDSNCNLKWVKPVVQGSFSLDHYKIWDTNTSGTVIGSTITESIAVPIYWTGNKVFCIAAVDSKGYTGTTALTTATVSLPVAPTIVGADCGFTLDSYIIKWNAVPFSSNTVPIEEYEVGYYTDYGTTNQAEVSLGRIKGTIFSGKAQWLGQRVFWVKSVDILGNAGTASDSVALTIYAPSTIPGMQVEVVDNNVLLYWEEPSATLPILTYEIREGDSWASYNRIIGTKTGNFTTIFETQAGVFTYWLNAIDSAGNYGTPNSLTTTVNQPPDYILKSDYDTTFTTGTPSISVTKTNMFYDVDDAQWVMPIDTTETFQSHFTSRNWSTPQNQVDDLFTLFIEPGTTTGYYEEVLDYGTPLAANKITITPSYEVLSPNTNPRVKGTISTSLDNSTWLDNDNVFSIYATNFRYVKYRFTVDAAKAATYTQTSTTATISLSAHGLLTGDSTFLDFTSGASSNNNDNLYTVNSVVDTDTFRVIVTTSQSQVSPANVLVYSSKFYGIVGLQDINIRLDSKLKTITGSVPVRNTIASAGVTQSGYTITVNKTAHGIKIGEVVELDHGLTAGTYSQSGTQIIVTKTAHGLLAGEPVILDFTSGNASEDYFTILSADANTFTVSASISVTTSGNVLITQAFKVVASSTDSFTLTNLVSKSRTTTSNIDPKGTCVFLTIDRTPDSDREYIDVDAITLTPGSTTPLIAVYDFTDKINPYFFRIYVYTDSGTRTSVSSCSYTIRGF